jgi:hypothetical protein
MPVDEEQSSCAEDIAERRKGAEEDGTVAAVDQREAARLQRRLYSGIHGLHHLEERWLVQEASQRPSHGDRFGYDDVGSEACAGERTARAVEADADEVQRLTPERHLYLVLHDPLATTRVLAMVAVQLVDCVCGLNLGTAGPPSASNASA